MQHTKPVYQHNISSYIFFACAFVQVVLLLLGISTLSSPDTFLGGIFLVEALLIWNKTGAITPDAIYIKKNVLQKIVIPFSEIKRATFVGYSIKITLKNGNEQYLMVGPELLKHLKAHNIKTPLLPQNISFKMKHSVMEKLALFQVVLMATIWKNECILAGYQTLATFMMWFAFTLLLLFVLLVSSSISYKNSEVTVKGFMQIYQKLSIKDVTEIKTFRIATIPFYVAYAGTKRVFVCSPISHIGLFICLVHQLNNKS